MNTTIQPLEAILQSIRDSLEKPQQQELAAIVGEQPDYHDLCRLIGFLNRIGKPDEAEKLTAIALQRNPSSLDIGWQLTFHHLDKENVEPAEKQLKTLVEKITKAITHAQFSQAVLMLKSGQYQKAYEILSELHKKFPNTPSIVLHYALACGSSLRAADGSKLLNQLTTSLQPSPKERAEGLYHYATTLFAKNEFAIAQQLAEQAVRLRPDRELFSSFLETVRKKNQQTEIPKRTIEQSLQIPSAISNKIDFGSNSVDESDVFNKRVPPESRDKKSGMKICFLATVDTAGQFSLLERAMNRYSPHRVRSIFADHCGMYPLDSDRVDICLNRVLLKEGDPVLEEALAVIREADFFHVYEGGFSLPGFDYQSVLNSKNCVWQYCGTSIRAIPEKRSEYHRTTGTEFIFNWDSTCIKDLHRCFYHIQPYIIDFDILPKPSLPDRPVRVCHSPTNRLAKGTEHFFDAMTALSKKFDTEAVIVEKVMNDECLKIKSTCHILYDQLTQIGLNAIEGLAMGLPSIGMISSYMRVIQYDTPVVSATPETLKNVLQRLIEDDELRATIGKKSKEWVIRNFAPQRRVRDYGLLYDYIKHGDRPFEQFAEGWDEEILQWGYEDMGYIYSKT